MLPIGNVNMPQAGGKKKQPKWLLKVWDQKLPEPRCARPGDETC